MTSDVETKRRRKTSQEIAPAQMATAEEVWDIINGVVLTVEINGHKQRVSIDTINGKKVSVFVDIKKIVEEERKTDMEYINANTKEKVKLLFPEGLPTGTKATFISVSEDEVA